MANFLFVGEPFL